MSDGLEDLTAGEVTQVAGVVVTHQQLRRALSHFANAGDVFLRRRGGFHLVAPIGTEVEGEIFLEGLTAVELLKSNRSQHRMLSLIHISEPTRPY